MDKLSLHVLLVEDNPTDVLLLRDALDQVPTITFVLTHVERLDAGLKCLDTQSFDAVLLDLGLPDSQGLATLAEMQSRHPGVPIMVLSGLDDEDIAVRAVQGGAQDYLVKGKINGTMVALTIRYAIERKRSEQRLMAAEVGYRRLFETAQDGIFLLDADTGQITDANPSLETLLGYKKTELVGKRLWEIAPFRDKAANQAAFRTLKEKGFIRYDDLPLMTRDGELVNVEFVSNVYAAGDKHVIQCNIRDITERKRVEVQLIASETSLAKSQQMAHLGSWELDLSDLDNINTNTLRWSDEIFRLLGYTPGEFEPSNEAFFRAVHPDDRENLSRAMAAAVTGGKPYSIDHRIIRPDGQERTIHAEAEVVYSASGQPLKIVGLGQDITEREKIKQQLQAHSHLLNVIGQAVIVTDFMGTVTYWNHFAETLYGWSAAEAQGRNILELTPTKTTHQPAEEILERLMRGESWSGEFLVRGRNGIPFQAYVNNTPVLDEAGHVIAIIGLSLDITERKHAEAQLIFQKTLLEAQSEASQDGILVVSGEGKILSNNQRFLHMWEVPHPTVADGEDAPLLQAVSEKIADPQAFVEKVAYLYDHRDERSHDEIFLLDGRIFDRYSAPVTSATGTYYGRVWYFRDITNRKQAETLLRESQKRLALATESAQIGIWDWDVVTNQLVWDAQMLALYGIRAENFSGAYDIWKKGLHPEDRDKAEAALQAALAGDRDFHTQFRVIWPPDEVRHIEAHALVQRAHDGSPLRMTGVNWDITERKQAEERLRRSEERYRSLALTTTQIVWVTDANGLVEDMPAWREFTGQSIDEVRGANWVEAVHPDDREPTLKIWARSVETASFYETEYRIRAANGEYRLFAVRGVPVLETGGGIREWVGTCTDIHDLRLAEEERDRFFTLSLDMLVIIGNDGYMKRLNPAFEATLGFSPAEMMAVPFIEFVHPDDRTATRAEAAKLASGAPIVQFENRYRCRDGSYKWLRWMCAPYEQLWYCVAHDITGVMQIAVDLQNANDGLERRVEERTAQLQLEISERARAEGKVRVQARQNEAVAELGRRALLNIDLDTLLEGAVALVSGTLEVNFCSYWERLPDTDTLRMRTGAGLTQAMRNPRDKTIGDNTQIGYTALGTVPVFSEDLERETRFRPALYLVGMGITSLITVPVHDGKLYGVLAVASPDKQKFSQSEVHFLQTVANVLSSAIVRKQAEAQNLQLNLHLQGANDELRANEARLLKGNQISTDLMRLRVRTHDELQEALHKITQAASMMLNIERSSVWLFNEAGSVMHCHDLYERSLDRHSSGFELGEDASYFPAIKAQREVVADDARTNPVTSAYGESYLEPNGVASILDVALVVGGKHIGVLCCEHVGQPRQWEAEDRIFASAVASVTSLVLESYERARIETDLQASKMDAERATEEANAANHAKSEFLSRMSHELRTPLNAILGFGQILDKQNLDPLSKESAGYILKGGRHLLELINEVLDIARVESGHLELSLEPIALADIVPEACALVRPLLTERSIRLEENLMEMGSQHIMADRQRLKQVLINLLSNAVKYNREGGLVEILCAQKTGGWISIAVRDTGPGIAPQDLPKLFTPFERLSAANLQIEGTGLGLALSQRLMTVMGGSLRVESILGHGATFILELPQAISPEVQFTDLTEGIHPFDTRKEAEHTYTVLCVEDNLSNLRLIEVLFQGRPEITLLVAMQGSVGLDMARLHEPDLILLDLNLPDIHGKEVLARLQQSALTRDIPIIVISADATPNQVERLLAAGAKAYLTKPLDVSQFLHTLDTFLQPSVTGAA